GKRQQVQASAKDTAAMRHRELVNFGLTSPRGGLYTALHCSRGTACAAPGKYPRNPSDDPNKRCPTAKKRTHIAYEPAHPQHAVACPGRFFPASAWPCAHVCLRHDRVRPVPCRPCPCQRCLRRGAAVVEGQRLQADLRAQ